MDTEHKENAMSEQQSTDKRRKVLQMVAADMKSDARELDGKPFTGPTVGEHLGNQGAAIAVLAEIVESLLPAAEPPVDEDQKARIAEYIRTVESSRVARSDLGEVVVSTMWVGFDPKRRRIETMILGGEFDGYTVERPYADEADARFGHATVVDALRAGRTPDGLVL